MEACSVDNDIERQRRWTEWLKGLSQRQDATILEAAAALAQQATQLQEARKELEELQHSVLAFKVASDALLAALKSVVETFGPWHDDDCPGDDTCGCSAKPIHDAVNAAVAKAEGR